MIGRDCFLAENASVIGDVTMGDECSIWFNTVLRGDVNTITIGNRVNIQDGSVLHTLYQKSTIEIGDDVSIGHNVTIHGAKIRNFALIGMGSVVMDDAVVGEGAIVAAGSVVLSRTNVPPHELWGGAPSKFIKKVDPEQAKADEVELAVQLNGKVKAKVTVAADAEEDQILEIALADAKVQNALAGMEIVKRIVIKKKIVNFVVKPQK